MPKLIVKGKILRESTEMIVKHCCRTSCTQSSLLKSRAGGCHWQKLINKMADSSKWNWFTWTKHSYCVGLCCRLDVQYIIIDFVCAFLFLLFLSFFLLSLVFLWFTPWLWICNFFSCAHIQFHWLFCTNTYLFNKVIIYVWPAKTKGDIWKAYLGIPIIKQDTINKLWCFFLSFFPLFCCCCIYLLASTSGQAPSK